MNQMESMVERAKELAYRAHAGQVDKAGRPYIEHVARVAAAVADDPKAEAVAWLHDVIEDCEDFREEVYDLLPIDVLASVLAISRNVQFPNYVEDYYERIKLDKMALRVKLADIADNSDESRLRLLDEATANRLHMKYAKARKALGVGE